MTLSRNEACQRLSSLGLKQDVVHKIIDQVDSWMKQSGPEWTISRLKSLKTDFIRKLAGKDERTAWVAFRADGSPKGVLGILFKLKGKKANTRALNALMVYSSFVSDHVTAKQWKKFHSSVVSPQEEGGSMLVWLYSPTLMSRLQFKSRPPVAATLDDVVLGNTSVPVYRGGKCKESEISRWFPDLAQRGVSRRLAQRYPEAFAGIKPDAQRYWSTTPDWDVVPVMGKIGFIQEAGYKLRAVANPDRIVQIALEPLRKELARCLKATFPTDCTFDQEAGVECVRGWLQEGHRVHSVDLSDATNNFPLRLQMLLIKQVLGKQWKPWYDLFEEASRAKWSVRDPELGLTHISWTKGQPLGLGPSFVSFAFAHNYLVSTLQTEVGGDFRILGDDIVIIGDELAAHYRKALASLGCPISEDKSISSDRVAEFAGKVITRDGVIQPYKWRKVSDRNFLDLARSLGRTCLGLLQPRQRAIVHQLEEIPEEFGGLGWNPHGKTFEDRFFENLDLIRRLESERLIPYQASNSELIRLRLANLRQGSFSDFLSKVPKATSPESTRLSGIQDVRNRIISETGVLWEGFRESEDLPIGFRPMVKESDPRGPTTLDRYENLLGTRPVGYRSAPKTNTPCP